MCRYQMACLPFLPPSSKCNSSCMFKIQFEIIRKHFVFATGAANMYSIYPAAAVWNNIFSNTVFFCPPLLLIVSSQMEQYFFP